MATPMIARRGLLAGLGALLAAPSIIRTPGLLMPVKAAPLVREATLCLPLFEPGMQVRMHHAHGLLRVFDAAGRKIMEMSGEDSFWINHAADTLRIISSGGADHCNKQ